MVKAKVMIQANRDKQLGKIERSYYVRLHVKGHEPLGMLDVSAEVHDVVRSESAASPRTPPPTVRCRRRSPTGGSQ